MSDDPLESVDIESDSPGQKGGVFTCLVQVVTAVGLVLLLIAILLPAVTRSRHAARRIHCRNNLKSIGLALHNYHEAYGAFPPAYTVDAEGNPLHSWRTLILPHFAMLQIDEGLYEKIDFSKPWNDPANAEVFAARPYAYHCPSYVLTGGQTPYLAVVTANSCLRPTDPRPISDVTDDRGETLMVFEVAPEHTVHWMAPQDADEEIVLDAEPETDAHHTGGSFALFVDGRTRFLDVSTTADERRRLISISGNEKSPVD